jgi:hypothetical protein
LFTSHGFEVLNDTETPTTIDTLSPYAWNNTYLQTAANGGADLFFIGGHQSYNEAGIPGDDFSPDDTPTHYLTFGANGPLAMIVGCHGGLSVPEADGMGGAADNMVRDLVHEGASGYIGATGFSYGSVRDLHDCIWGERLIQGFFGELLTPANSASEPIGRSMRQAKRQYVFGLGHWDAADRKTVTAFVVYGVPWQRINYPGTTSYALQAAQSQGPAGVSRQVSEIQRAGPTSFTQNVTIDIAQYQAGKVEGFDLLTIPGGELDYSDGYPVVPFVEGFALPLPSGATVEGVQIVDQHSRNVGPYNLPTVRVLPFTQGGIQYTDETTLNSLYPTELVVVEVRNDTALFHVSPIQHNPTSNATRFYGHLELAITYSTPHNLTVTDLTTDHESYKPGQPIVSEGRMHNVGDGAENVTVHLSIVDAFGVEVGTVDTGVVPVPAGGTRDLQLTWPGTLPGGAYNVVWHVKKVSETVATAARSIQVITARITRFTTPEFLFSGDTGSFALTFANYGAAAIDVDLEIVLYDQATGFEAARLPRRTARIDAGQEKTSQWNWNSAAVPAGNYTAVALVTVDGDLHGPAWGSLRILGGERTRIWLPLVRQTTR